MSLEHFNTGSGEGRGGAPVPPNHWSKLSRPLRPEDRPNIPHKENEGAYGDYAPIKLSEEQKTANARAKEDQSNFDKVYESQKQALKASGTPEVHPEVQKELDKIAAAKSAPRAERAPAAERPSRTPANRIRGTVVLPTLPGRKLVNHADKTHRLYSTIATNLSVSKDPVVADMGKTALAHLDQAKPLIEQAKAEHDAGGDAQFHGNERIIEAHPLIKAAHDALDNEYVHSYGERAGVNTELPKDALDKLKEGADTATVLKKAAPMPDINFGGKSRRLDSPEIKEAKKRARREGTPEAKAAYGKITTGERGTDRAYARDRNTPVEGAVTGEDMEATTPMGAGRSGRGPRAKKPVSSTPRATPVQIVRTPASKSAPKTNISNGSKVGVTPKFDATTEAGETPKGTSFAPSTTARPVGPMLPPVQGPANKKGSKK